MCITDTDNKRFANNLAYLDPVKAAFIITFGGGLSDQEIEKRCNELLQGQAGTYYNEIINN